MIHINKKGFVSLGEFTNTAGGIRWTEEVYLPWFDETRQCFVVNAWDGQTGPGNHKTEYVVPYKEVVAQLGEAAAKAAKAKCRTTTA